MIFPTRILLSLVLAIMACAITDTAQAEDIVLAPSSALACLTRAEGTAAQPTYPKIAYEVKEGGIVKAQMVFYASGKAPRIKIERNDLDNSFDDAVRDYLDGYRLPCLKEGDEPVHLRQEYSFIPNDGRKVMSTSPEDEADEGRRQQVACIKNIEGWERPYFPETAAREGVQGNFYVELAFAAADTPPEVKWIAAADNKAFRRAIESYADKLRMPCHAGGLTRVRMIFKFRMEDGDRTVFRDMKLRDFLFVAKKIPTPIYFDLNSMACPFDLRITYLQPYAPNRVSELETLDAARKPLVDWISNIALDLTANQANQMLGDSFNLSIPCGSISL